MVGKVKKYFKKNKPRNRFPVALLSSILILYLSAFYSLIHNFSQDNQKGSVLNSKIAPRENIQVKKPNTPSPVLKKENLKENLTNSNPNPSTTTKSVATPSPSPSQSPSVENKVTTSDPQAYIMNKINDYRKSQGLSVVSVDSTSCGYAATRANEISKEFSHAGHENRVNNKTLPYSNWSLVTENIAMTPDYKQVVDLWINSPGHAENMRRDTPFVCVASFGNYYAYEGYKP